jgi:hypothetical protein
MMFTDRDHRARLWALGALGFLSYKSDLVAYGEFVEAAIDRDHSRLGVVGDAAVGLSPESKIAHPPPSESPPNPPPSFEAEPGRLAGICAKGAGRMPAILIEEGHTVSAFVTIVQGSATLRCAATSSEMTTIFAHVFGDLAAPLNI